MDLVTEEILVRLKMLQDLHGLVDYAVNDYEYDNDVYVSGIFNVYGKQELGCVPIDDLWIEETPLLCFVVDFEKKFTGCKVYHVITGGPFINLLYISSNKDKWEYERPDEYNVESYVINLAIPEYSEFGRIAIKGDKGVLIRTE